MHVPPERRRLGQWRAAPARGAAADWWFVGAQDEHLQAARRLLRAASGQQPENTADSASSDSGGEGEGRVERAAALPCDNPAPARPQRRKPLRVWPAAAELPPIVSPAQVRIGIHTSNNASTTPTASSVPTHGGLLSPPRGGHRPLSAGTPPPPPRRPASPVVRSTLQPLSPTRAAAAGVLDADDDPPCVPTRPSPLLERALLMRVLACELCLDAFAAEVTDETLREVALLCPEVTRLSLAGCARITRVGLRDVSAHAGARMMALRLAHTPLDSVALHALALSFTALQELDLSHCVFVTNATLKHVAGGCNATLRALNLSHCPGITDEALAWMSGTVGVGQAACRRLRTLDVSCCPGIGDRGMSALAGGCSALQFLNLEACRRVSCAGLAVLAAGCRRLRVLRLTDCLQVKDSVLQALGQHCHDLRSLALQRCLSVTDAGVIALARGCPRLERLALPGCFHVTEVALCELAAGCPNLHSLNVTGCDKVTEEGLLHMSRGLRFCEPATTFRGLRPVTDPLTAKLKHQHMLLRQRCARQIQTLYRGHLARRAVRFLRWRRAAVPAASAVQRVWRRHRRVNRWRVAVRAVLLMNGRITLAQAAARGMLARRGVARLARERRERQCRHAAATRMQAAFRRHRVLHHNERVVRWLRARARRAVHARRTAAAACVQRGVRCWMARRCVAALRRERVARQRTEAAAAVVVQAGWRGRCGRIRAKQARARVLAHEAQWRYAAITLQCATRQLLARRERQRRFEARQRLRQRQREAATRLQAMWRGIRGRWRAEDARQQRRMLNAAATDIQRVWRGWRVAHWRALRLRFAAERALAGALVRASPRAPARVQAQPT